MRMRSIRTAAVILALVGGAGLGVEAMVLAQPGGAPAAAAPTGKARVAMIEIKGKLVEKPGPLDWLTGGDMTMRTLTGALRQAAGDASLKAIVLRLKDAELTGTQVQELSAAVAAARAGGKRVVVYSDLYDPGALMLAAAADEAVIQAGGAVSLPGLAVQEMYLADALAWAGVKGDFVQIGDYKGASEMMANAKPSRQWDENINSLLDSLYGNLRAAFKAGRKMDDAALDKAMETAWAATDEEAKKVGLIDTIIDLPDLGKHLAKGLGAETVEWTDDLGTPKGGGKMDAANPFAMLQMLSSKPEHTPKRDTIAVLHIDGAIVDGESGAGGLMGDATVGSRTIRRALSAIEESPLIKGVIVRIDSPGGSAIASEIIWQGLRRVAAKKPVYVSVGSMAASGGYYIAVAGERIYVNPSSIVGSIGVVGGKLATGGLMEKLKVNVVERTRGPRATLLGGMTPWSEADRRLVRDKMVQTYELFTKRVSAGRKGIELARTAEGRLFTGDRAVELKMADKVAPFDVAAADLAKSLNLAEGAYDLMDYPGPKSLGELIEAMLGVSPSASLLAPVGRQAAEEVGVTVLGPRGYRALRASVAALLQLRKEPVILVAPSVIVGP